VLVGAAPSILPNAENGRIRALAVTSAKRSPVAPELPSLERSGFKESASELWWGVLAPAGTPQPIVDRLNAEIGKVLRMPDMKEFLLKEGVEPASMKSGEFEAFIAADVERWKKLAKLADIKED
jgi:tripartite-type tricarboxylate transporter receptor subunit TctC